MLCSGAHAPPLPPNVALLSGLFLLCSMERNSTQIAADDLRFAMKQLASGGVARGLTRDTMATLRGVLHGRNSAFIRASLIRRSFGGTKVRLSWPQSRWSTFPQSKTTRKVYLHAQNCGCMGAFRWCAGDRRTWSGPCANRCTAPESCVCDHDGKPWIPTGH